MYDLNPVRIAVTTARQEYNTSFGYESYRLLGDVLQALEKIVEYLEETAE
jgi:hypothetical protein